MSWRFGDIAKKGNEPIKVDHTGKTNQGWPGTTVGGRDTAHGIANDLKTNLNKEQRNKVAGLLSKTISGAEVVEIRAVSTTSVMLNSCYDLEQLGKSLQLILHVSDDRHQGL